MLRERAGTDSSIGLELADDATVADLLAELGRSRARSDAGPRPVQSP